MDIVRILESGEQHPTETPTHNLSSKGAGQGGKNLDAILCQVVLEPKCTSGTTDNIQLISIEIDQPSQPTI